MRYCLLALLLLPAVASAQPQAPPPPQAPAVKADCGCGFGGECRCARGECDCPGSVNGKPATAAVGLQAKTYSEAYQSALRRQTPLVVFVGGMERYVPGCESVAAKTLAGYPERCVVVSVPASDSLHWKATLPATATNAEILASLRKEVRQAAQATPAPFRSAIRFAPARASAGGSC